MLPVNTASFSIPWLLVTLFGGVSLLLIGAYTLPGKSELPELNVAFVGNSMQFVNDIPRLVQTFSGDKIYQDSVFHGGETLRSLLRHGNGMYKRWKTRKARLRDAGVYDFGACTVRQMLLGYDENLSYENENGYYIDDGLNPCFLEGDYFEYVQTRYNASIVAAGENTKWNYVVLNDKSDAPSNMTMRSSTLGVLKTAYAEMFLEAEAIPVLLMTHGYWRDDPSLPDSIMGDFRDVPTFTSKLYLGYEMYAQALQDLLPAWQAPIIAPSGLAFLVIWEENRGMWERLFSSDRFHPSPMGTFLEGCVIFCTLYGQPPPIESMKKPKKLFSRTRRRQIHSDKKPLPTFEEALYLRSVAKRVVLNGYIPKTLDLNVEDGIY